MTAYRVQCHDCGQSFHWVSDYLAHDCTPTHPRTAALFLVAGLVLFVGLLVAVAAVVRP